MVSARSILGGLTAWFVLAALAATPALAQTDAPQSSPSPLAGEGQGEGVENSVVEFDIDAQPLSSALIQLSQQAGVQVVMEGERANGTNVGALRGEYAVMDALDLLLLDTGFTADQTGPLTYTVKAPQGASTAGQNTIGQRRPGIEEIIVTGQKREERIQDVPIAISAFSPEDLEAQKIEGGFDLLKGVPNVTFSKTNFSGYNFQIRGIGTQAISATTDPGVAVSFNNTTLIVNRLFEQEYLDVERVEVLRGPQGTLFGRNATGGVINVITNKPEMGVWDGMLDVEVGNYNTRRLRGFFNAPIGDDFAIRGAYASTIRDGYGYNEYSEVKDNPFRDPVQADVDDRDLWTGRLSLGWEPNDRFRMNLIWERFEEDDRRVRTSKQLCHRDTGFAPPHSSTPSGFMEPEQFFFSAASQGCKPGSLYADEAFGTPNGASLPYLSGLFWGTYYANNAPLNLSGAGDNEKGLGGNPYLGQPTPVQGNPGCNFVFGIPTNEPCNPDLPPFEPGELIVPAQAPLLENPCPDTFGSDTEGWIPIDVCNPDIYRGQMQSRDLRTISSQLEPKYRATSDIFELAFDYELSDELLFSSQTVYAEDEYYATQDYNRFTAFPIWRDSRAACGLSVGEYIDCRPQSEAPDTGRGTYADGFYADLSPAPDGTPLGSPGVVCDPQLGCSDTLLIQDLSRSESEQFNQEFRLVSSFAGDWNFSLGANYTRFETFNDYFVFANALTHLTNFFPFNAYDSQCIDTSSPASIESRQFDGEGCIYVDPNPLESMNGEGHNYFRSGNPYKLRSAALFGELYWNVTDTVKITAGLRFTWDRKVFTPLPSQLLLTDYRAHIGEGQSEPDECTNFRITCPFAGTAPDGRGYLAEPDIIQEWREPTGRLVVDWQPVLDFTDETLVYASYSRGYKGGGANPPSVAQPAQRFLIAASGGFQAPPTFEPEYVNAYEIGTKNTLFGGAIVMNAAAFYYDYTDYQISKILDRSAFNENFDAEVWGLELETIFAPSVNWQFNAAIGYLNTKVAEGETSIDLMDRTDGGNRHFAADPDDLGNNSETTDFPDGFDEWVVIQPWISAASNCIVPRELIEANAQASALGAANFLNAYCPSGNVAGASAAGLGTAYFDESGNIVGQCSDSDPQCRNYDPAKDAPNGGQGFAKDLGGNELPNAPQFTVALGGQYGFDLTRDWRATARLDYYWQDQSYARIYNMPDYDRLKSWSNTNLSFWVNNPVTGITVEAYVKNVFDETPITGTFLNSDDSGLTTNVFTLDPRLIGVSIRKEF